MGHPPVSPPRRLQNLVMLLQDLPETCEIQILWRHRGRCFNPVKTSWLKKGNKEYESTNDLRETECTLELFSLLRKKAFTWTCTQHPLRLKFVFIADYLLCLFFGSEQVQHCKVQYWLSKWFQVIHQFSKIGINSLVFDGVVARSCDFSHLCIVVIKLYPKLDSYGFIKRKQAEKPDNFLNVIFSIFGKDNNELLRLLTV